MKKVFTTLKILAIVMVIAFSCANVVQAFDVNALNSSVPLGGADTAMTNIGSTILTVVTNTAMILAIVLIAILGVKYMVGSTEEKAEYKKSMIPYLVGAVLVFGAGVIGKMVIGFGQSIR